MRTWIALLLAPACNTARESSWQLVGQEQPSAQLAVWGADANDLWVVGSHAELEGDASVLHYRDGWTRVPTGQTSLDLWWVFGVAADDVFFSGTGGTILRFHDGAFERMTTPRTGTIFGIWGTSASDLWAVGDGGAAGGIVWHFDGEQWSEPPLPAGVPSRVFKVQGRASDDVWMSCGDGSVLHWQGSAIERQLTGTTTPLFSIVTTPDAVVAVGGRDGEGQILEYNGEWTVAPIASLVRWRGAAARGDTLYAVGERGQLAKRERGTWTLVDQTLTKQDFHSAWIDLDGALWAVGGDYLHVPLIRGFIEYFGAGAIEEVEP